jgi:lipopolysaccharide biosynthesis glycosyltransferase
MTHFEWVARQGEATLDILYCGDDNMFEGLIISILSLTKHAHEPLKIYIMTGHLRNKHRQFQALSDDHIDFLNDLAKQGNNRNAVIKIDMTEKFEAELPTANINTSNVKLS